MARDELGKFLPGESGNPNGRPKKGQTLTEMMEEYLKGSAGDLNRKEAFIMRVYNLALSGDLTAIKLIWNYIDGMPKQKIEYSSDDELKEADYERLKELFTATNPNGDGEEEVSQ